MQNVTFKSAQECEVFDITPFTTLDFAGHLAMIIWFAGCNMRCKYCYNPEVVNAPRGRLSNADVLGFLRARAGLLSGVVMSGGECSRAKSLLALAASAKGLNYAVKIDTNGSNPAVIKELAKRGCIDFCSLDFKAPKKKFAAIAGADFYEQFWQTFDVLKTLQIPFEVRTTWHADLLTNSDIYSMQKLLSERGYERPYALQIYRHADTLGGICEPQTQINLQEFCEDARFELR